ncbi:MAG: hypothetical protein ACR2IS_14250 [Nitrososphaeraceae archaeon]
MILLLTSSFLLSATITDTGNDMQAFAHQTYDFGNITLTAGWEIEPPLVDQLNSVEVNIMKNGSEGGITPVRNAFSELDASIKSGGLTKTLDFEPQEESAGLYRAQISPTQVGSYSLLLIGKIEDQPLNSEIQIEDVEDITKYAFPLQQGQEGSILSSESSGAPVPQRPSANLLDTNSQLRQLSPLISDLTQQINATDDRATRAQNASQETSESLEQLRGSVDKAYVFAMISVGIGTAGILIGAFALSKKGQRPTSSTST